MNFRLTLVLAWLLICAPNLNARGDSSPAPLHPGSETKKPTQNLDAPSSEIPGPRSSGFIFAPAQSSSVSANPMMDFNSPPPGAVRARRSGNPTVGVGGNATSGGGVGLIKGAVGHF